MEGEDWAVAETKVGRWEWEWEWEWERVRGVVEFEVSTESVSSWWVYCVWC